MGARLGTPDAVADRSLAWIAGATVVVSLAVVARFVALDASGVHWDEGVHAYHAWEFLATGEFTYEPWRHGPLLYFASVPAMALLGESVVAGRAVVALLSLAVFPALWLLRDELPTSALAFSALVLAVHPYVLSTARFYRNDAVLAAFVLLTVGAYARYYRTGRWYWAALVGTAAGLAFAAKEVAFLVVPAVALAVLVVVHFAARFEYGSTRVALDEYLPPRYLPVAAVTFAAVLVGLFGGWPPSPTDSPGQFLDGLAFWLTEGREESGAITYYLARLGVGTPVLFALAVVGTLGTVLRPSASWFRWPVVAWAGLVGLVLSLIGDQSWWNVVVVFVPLVLLAGYGLADLLDGARWVAGAARRVADAPSDRPGESNLAPPRSERLGRSWHVLAAVGLATVAAGLVLAVALGAVPAPDAVAGVERPNDTALVAVEGVTAPDEPDPRDRAFDAARAAALATGCGAVVGPGTYEWPARWWFRGVDYERTDDLGEADLPAVVVTGEKVTALDGGAYQLQTFDTHRVYVPRNGCTDSTISGPG